VVFFRFWSPSSSHLRRSFSFLFAIRLLLLDDDDDDALFGLSSVSLFAHHHHHHHHHLSLSLSTMSLDSFFGCKDTSRKHTIKSERVPSFPLFEVVSSRFFALSLSLSFSLSRNNNSTTRRKGFRRRTRRTRRKRRRESSSKKWREFEILFTSKNAKSEKRERKRIGPFVHIIQSAFKVRAIDAPTTISRRRRRVGKKKKSASSTTKKKRL